MDQIQIHPTGEANRGLLITEAVRGAGAILVNENGERFTNELLTRNVVSKAIIDQLPSKVYLIYDEFIRNTIGAIKSYEEMNFVTSGNTIEELAAAINVSPQNLKSAVDAYNVHAADKTTDAFGRTEYDKPISEGSFYAIEVFPVIHHTMGGISVNTNSQVLSTNNRPVNGLYAAGEAVGGVHGGNRLGGNAVADIVIFGRRSGQRAANYAQQQ